MEIAILNENEIIAKFNNIAELLAKYNLSVENIDSTATFLNSLSPIFSTSFINKILGQNVENLAYEFGEETDEETLSKPVKELLNLAASLIEREYKNISKEQILSLINYNFDSKNGLFLIREFDLKYSNYLLVNQPVINSNPFNYDVYNNQNTLSSEFIHLLLIELIKLNKIPANSCIVINCQNKGTQNVKN